MKQQLMQPAASLALAFIPPCCLVLRSLLAEALGELPCANPLYFWLSLDYDYPVLPVTGKPPSWISNVQKDVKNAFQKAGADQNIHRRTEELQHRSSGSQWDQAEAVVHL